MFILAIWHFLGATSCSNNNAELTGFAEARRWICFFHPSRRIFFLIQSTRLVLPLVLITPEETLLQPANASNSCAVRSAFFRISFHHVFSHAGNSGSRRSCPTRSSRMFTPICGGKKRGGPACRLRLGVPPAWLPVATTTQVSTTATAAKGGVLQLTMETINYQGTGSFSQPPPALDDWMPTTPLVSLPPDFQSLPLPDADRSLTGFRPVDCRLLLRVDDAFSSYRGRPPGAPS